jgi:hypothetical protein
MKHRIIVAGILLLSGALAHAQPIEWNFSYTGFYDREAAAFLDDRQLHGAFAGDDANGDGVLERSELTSLLVGDTDYVACATSTPTAYCGADRFTWSIADGLSFSLGSYGGDPEGWAGGGHLITSGDMDYEYRYDPASSSEHHLMWTDATRLDMQDAATRAGVMSTVPEAPAWTLLLAGAGAMGALHRLQARRIGRGGKVRQRTEP